jgi:uncharacterized protein
VFDGHYCLAFLHFRGLGVAQDPVMAVTLLQAAASGGSAEAAWALHRQYADGEYLMRDAEEAMHWLLRAAQLGNVAAACALAQTLGRQDPLAPPRDTVVELLEKCAHRGDADAQICLALLYYEGTPSNTAQALIWFSRAANGGNAIAQAWVGDLLAKGIGVPADLEAADMWYEQAANKGHAGAAQALMELRAAQGNLPAMAQLASQILSQSEEPADLTRAVVLLRQAAAAGHTDALYNLGECLRLGRGVVPNQIEARRSHEAAARQGHYFAQCALEMLDAAEILKDAEPS